MIMSKTGLVLALDTSTVVNVGLASTKITSREDHISALEQLGQSRSQPHHRNAGRNLDRQRQRLGQDHTMRDRAIDHEAAVLPEGNEVRELGPCQ